MAGNPLVNTLTGWWKPATDMRQILMGILVELRIQNAIIAAGLNQEPLLDSLRGDVTSTIPDAANLEYNNTIDPYPQPGD